MTIALIGATGLVGSTFIEVIEERNFPFSNFIPVASRRSLGKEIELKGRKYKIRTIEDCLEAKPDIAFFSAGSELSLQWAPKFANAGTIVIDNSSAWRMDGDKKLIVPEVNGSQLDADDKIIANPNCSTIQMVVAIAPVHRKYGIKRLVVSTYQSVSGTGQKGLDTLLEERKGNPPSGVYPHPIDLNCLPHCGPFSEDGQTEEERKLINETHKILDPNVGISATAVRVPVIGGHSESVNLELEKSFQLEDIKALLRNAAGVQLVDEPTKSQYPMPINALGKNEVLVGRLRRDPSLKNGLNMWVVADNLRKGAATNAIQIGELILSKYQ